MALHDSDFDGIWFHVQLEVLSEYCKESVDTGSGRTVRGHSKSTFAQNFQFLTPLPPCSFLFILPPIPQHMFALVSCHPPPPPKKCFAMLMMLISNKKFVGEKREKY